MAKPARITGFRNTDVRPAVHAAARAFVSQAAVRIAARARRKIGFYQSGWPPLAASTLERKKYRRGRRGHRNVSYMIADTPLLDMGDMRAGVHGFARGLKAHVTAPFPAEVHEQDPDMARIKAGYPTPPARPFLGPSLAEELPGMITDLEAEVAAAI